MEDEFGSNPNDGISEDVDVDTPPLERKKDEERPKVELKQEAPVPQKKILTDIKIDASNLEDYLSEVNRLATIINQSQKSLTKIETSFEIINKLESVSKLNVEGMQKNFDTQLKSLDLGLFVKNIVEKEVTSVMKIVNDEILELVKTVEKNNKEVMGVIHDEMVELVQSYTHQNELLKNIILNDEWIIEKSDKPKRTFWQKTKSFMIKGLVLVSILGVGYALNPLLQKVKIVDGVETSEKVEEVEKSEAPRNKQIEKSFKAGTIFHEISTGGVKELGKDSIMTVIVNEDGDYIYKNKFLIKKGE